MGAHRQEFPTPRGDGESDPEGGVARLSDVVARRLWWVAPRPAFAEAKLRFRAGRRDALLAVNLATPS